MHISETFLLTNEVKHFSYKSYIEYLKQTK